jgi:hypothetical protein
LHSGRHQLLELVLERRELSARELASRYILDRKLCDGMAAKDVSDTLELAREASGLAEVNVKQRPRLPRPTSRQRRRLYVSLARHERGNAEDIDTCNVFLDDFVFGLPGGSQVHSNIILKEIKTDTALPFEV